LKLAAPGQIERFIGGSLGDQLRASFAGLWTLDVSEQDDSARAAVSNAIANPDQYVVKPQREGGGNNLYGEEARSALRDLPKEEQASFILMQVSDLCDVHCQQTGLWWGLI